MVRVSKQPDERRSELMETADKLFAERGFASVRVSDIVAAAGVAQGTFYYYFKTKDDILVALLEQKWSQIADYINEKASTVADPVARLKTALASMVKPDEKIKNDPANRLLADPAVTGAFHPDFDSARIKGLLPVMLGVIEYGIKKSAFAPLINTSEVVKIVFLGISAYFHQAEEEASPSAVAAVCVTVERVLNLPGGTLNIKN